MPQTNFAKLYQRPSGSRCSSTKVFVFRYFFSYSEKLVHNATSWSKASLGFGEEVFSLGLHPFVKNAEEDLSCRAEKVDSSSIRRVKLALFLVIRYNNSPSSLV